MDATEAATALNTAKTGITSGQASSIAANTSAVALRAPLASADFTGSLGIGDPLKASGLGLTIHQSGQAESGLSIYAAGGSDAVLNLMENKGDFGHATNGGTGFRLMYDGGDNKFKIRSGDDDTVNDRLTIERDSGDMVVSGKIVTPMVEAASNLELKATGSNAVKMFTNGSERCKVTSAGNLLFSTGLGLNLSKPTQSAIEWSANGQLIEVTINTVRSASIPFYSSFNMSGVQRFFLEVTSDQISEGSVIVAHSYSPNGYTDWLPEVSKLRSMYVSGSAGKVRVTGVVSGTHSMNGNSTTNLYVNYTIM